MGRPSGLVHKKRSVFELQKTSWGKLRLGRSCRHPGRGAAEVAVGWILHPAVHPAGRTWRGAGLGEPVFRPRLVGFGDRGPARGEQWRGGLWAGVPPVGAGGRPPTGSTPRAAACASQSLLETAFGEAVRKGREQALPGAGVTGVYCWLTKPRDHPESRVSLKNHARTS